MDDDDGFDLLRGYGVYVHLCTVQIGADRGRAEYMVQSTLVGAMPSQPQKDRNEARVTTSFGSEFSSLHTNLTRYNDIGYNNNLILSLMIETPADFIIH